MMFAFAVRVTWTLLLATSSPPPPAPVEIRSGGAVFQVASTPAPDGSVTCKLLREGEGGWSTTLSAAPKEMVYDPKTGNTIGYSCPERLISPSEGSEQFLELFLVDKSGKFKVLWNVKRDQAGGGGTEPFPLAETLKVDVGNSMALLVIKASPREHDVLIKRVSLAQQQLLEDSLIRNKDLFCAHLLDAVMADGHPAMLLLWYVSPRAPGERKSGAVVHIIDTRTGTERWSRLWAGIFELDPPSAVRRGCREGRIRWCELEPQGARLKLGGDTDYVSFSCVR